MHTTALLIGARANEADIEKWAAMLFARVDHARSAADFLNRAAPSQPSLLIADAAEIEALIAGGGGSAPVIALLPASYDAAARELLAPSIEDVLAPPFDEREFRLRCRRALRRAEEERALSRRDKLTGAATSEAWIEDAAELAGAAQAGNLAVFVVDVANFSALAARFGRAMGDKVLTTLVERLRSQVSARAAIGRIGRSAFAVAEILPAGVEAHKRARDFRNLILARFMIAGDTLDVDAAIGFLAVSDLTMAIEPLLTKAGSAARRARLAPDRLVDASNDIDVSDRKLAAELREALQSGAITLLYQIQAPFNARRPFGLEALLRWPRAGVGLAAPPSFLPLAAAHGLKADITRCVMTRALADLDAWGRNGKLAGRVSINVGADEIADGSVRAIAREVVSERVHRASRIDFDIASASLARSDDLEFELKALAEMGFTATLDCSGDRRALSAQLPFTLFHRVKFDPITLGAPNARGVVAKLRGQGLVIAATHVETRMQLSAARDIGCDEAQGSYLGHPCEARELFAPARATN